MFSVYGGSVWRTESKERLGKFYVLRHVLRHLESGFLTGDDWTLTHILYNTVLKHETCY